MASMVVRNIPDDAFERFKRRAKAEGKSTEQLAREMLVEHATPDRWALIDRIDARRARTAGLGDSDIVADIRADRARPPLGRE